MEASAKTDIEHFKWAIDRRGKVQQTILALYEFLESYQPEATKWQEEAFIDDLIAAAFSLWRAVFLLEKPRLGQSVRDAQLRFLHSILASNTITFNDDRTNSAWSATFYLQNAKHRLNNATRYADRHLADKKSKMALMDIRSWLDTRGLMPRGMRFEWDHAHSSVRLLLKVVHPEMRLPLSKPR